MDTHTDPTAAALLRGVLLAVEFRGRGLSGWLWGDELED